MPRRTSSHLHRRRTSRICDRPAVARCINLRAEPGTGLPTPQPLADEEIARNCGEDQRAEERISPELADLRNTQQALVEEVDKERSQKGADDGAGSTKDADPADNNGCDRGQLQAGSRVDRNRAEAKQEKKPRKPRHSPRERERTEGDAPDWKAG